MKVLLESVRACREKGEPSFSSIVFMKQVVINALLDGPESLAAIEEAIVRLGDDKFVLLATVPTVMRREYLTTFRSAACLIKSRLLLASLEDWQAWVNSIVPIWERRK